MSLSEETDRLIGNVKAKASRARKMKKSGIFIPDDMGNCGQCFDEFSDGCSECFNALSGACDNEVTGNTEWETDCIDCFDDTEICCCVMCCPLCTSSRAIAAYTGKSCEPVCCVELIFSYCYINGCFLASKRTVLRQRLGIKGTRQMDCLCAVLFPCCTICQEARELKNRRYDGFAEYFSDPVSRQNMD